MQSKRTVLITGCSDGGMGAELALAFHKANLHVYATARDKSKMPKLQAAGINTLELDVCSAESISACVQKLDGLDILVNNAGAQLLMPLSDLKLSEAKKLFDLNVWSHIAVVQAFLPLLLQSPSALIVNHTSISSVTTVPFQAIYSASKAAASIISDTLRLELEPFRIKVVELKTGLVRTNLIQNLNDTRSSILPKQSIYTPAREVVERVLRQEQFKGQGMPAEEWARATVKDLLKPSPSSVIWRGGSAWLMWFATFLPHGTLDGPVKKLTSMNQVENAVKKNQASRV